jgi:hypothetical protein
MPLQAAAPSKNPKQQRQHQAGEKQASYNAHEYELH